MIPLAQLDPKWLCLDGRRVGFVFRCPTKNSCWQSLFPDPPSRFVQVELFDSLLGEKAIVQPCNPTQHWQIAGGIDAANFETMTVTPSLDGSAGGLWHGFITNGVCK